MPMYVNDEDHVNIYHVNEDHFDGFYFVNVEQNM